eukprot:2346226-Prymnesium_polylepis.1
MRRGLNPSGGEWSLHTCPNPNFTSALSGAGEAARLGSRRRAPRQRWPSRTPSARRPASRTRAAG